MYSAQLSNGLESVTYCHLHVQETNLLIAGHLLLGLLVIYCRLNSETKYKRDRDNTEQKRDTRVARSSKLIYTSHQVDQQVKKKPTSHQLILMQVSTFDFMEVDLTKLHIYIKCSLSIPLFQFQHLFLQSYRSSKHRLLDLFLSFFLHNDEYCITMYYHCTAQMTTVV